MLITYIAQTAQSTIAKNDEEPMEHISKFIIIQFSS